MSVSTLRVSQRWKKFNLDLDILDINSDFITKKRKFSDEQIQDSTILGEKYGVCTKRGLRSHMEDSFKVIENFMDNSNTTAFAVFDGHSGHKAALFASQKLLDSIENNDKDNLRRAFEITDKAYCSQSATQDGGSTAAVAIIEGNFLITANVGDSKILLIKEEGYELLSYDHLANDPIEMARIELSGGYVVPVGRVLRVHGQLALSRSLGHAHLKDFVISEPYISEREISKKDLALVIATDGLYDVLSKDEISKTIREKSELKPFELAELLVQEAMGKGTRDNVTCIVVNLNETVN